MPIGIVLLVVLSLLAGCAAQQQPELWKASTLAEAPSPTIRLLNKEKVAVGYLDRSTAQKLIEIKNRIEDISGVSRSELLISADAQPNAFSGPTKQGTIMGVNLGMIELLGTDWDAYAAVVGHEYAHLALNHSGIRRQREETRQGMSTILGFVLGAAGVPFGGTIADVATTVVERTYSRDEERDADRVGLDYARRAGYDPQGAVRAWEKMMSASSGLSIPFLGTHPQSEERLETIRGLAARK